jgi:hypothetical protein
LRALYVAALAFAFVVVIVNGITPDGDHRRSVGRSLYILGIACEDDTGGGKPFNFINDLHVK